MAPLADGPRAAAMLPQLEVRKTATVRDCERQQAIARAAPTCDGRRVSATSAGGHRRQRSAGECFRTDRGRGQPRGGKGGGHGRVSARHATRDGDRRGCDTQTAEMCGESPQQQMDLGVEAICRFPEA
jgi:hypothetical protein